MAQKRTITLNGREYDAVTGLPIVAKKPAPKVVPKPHPAEKMAEKTATRRGQAASGAVHTQLQRSITLARRAAKKPAASVNKVIRRPVAGRSMDIAGPNMKKFAPHPVVKKPEAPDKPAQVHPAAERAIAKATHKKQAALKAAQPKTSKEVKDAAIEKALSAPKPKAKSKKKIRHAPWVRRSAIIGSIILAVLLGAYAVYQFVPSVSVSIAASQAGVKASFPDYIPDGYSLHQPVTYSDGEVVLTFASNSNDTNYTISQKRSSWDSSAVLDKVVVPLVGENYTTTQERGLTIYTFENGASWVNGGILYTITGDAQLSGDQVRRIATSL